MKKTKNKIPKFLTIFKGFKWLWITLIIFCSTNLLIHILLWPSSTDYLSLSLERPWGVITGAFVHKNLQHLFNNLWLFVIIVALYTLTNLFLPKKKKNQSGKIFFAGTLTAGTVVAGPLQLIARTSVGETVNVFGSSSTYAGGISLPSR